MKVILFIFACVFFAPQVTAQYVVDWKNAPLNPNPVIYTLNHLNISGPVKMYEKIILPSVSDTFILNEKGRITVFSASVHSYDNKGLLITIKTKSGSRTFTNSKDGFIKSDQWNISGQIYNYGYEYNEKGLYIKKIDLDNNNALLEKFDYDTNQRVVKQESWRAGKIIKTITYTYSKEDDFLKVIKKSTTDDAPAVETIYFDSRGNNYGANKNLKVVNDSHGNRLHFLNPKSKEMVKQQKFSYH
ncbi:hypothetical protein NT6N_15080 [Oceaniferula spumae]|uniref:YD repeat-containing protein n=1 Tax=Oceaniferula spumae TaxID=2979115 RepID=A0AAT9FKJ5_9BACT